MSFPAIGLILLILAGPAAFATFGADVKFIEIGKSIFYTQTASAPPLLQAGSAFEFKARIDLNRTQSVSSATLKLPFSSGATQALTNYGSYLELSQRYSSQPSMNFAFPNGTFTLNLQSAADGKKTNVMTLSNDVYPYAPQVVNFAPAQAIDSKADFTLQWLPPGTGANDFLRVRIFQGDQVVFESGSVPGSAGALGGSATSVMIPKNTLPEGGLFKAQIIATRQSTVDTKGYAGVSAWAAFAITTEFPLHTAFSVTDVQWYGIVKVQRFAQTSAVAPTAQPGGGFQFNAFAAPSNPQAVQSGSVKLANSSIKNMSATAGAGAWSWTDTLDTLGSIESSYPAGNYQVTIQTLHNGLQQLLLSLSQTAFPVPAQIINWTEANSVDPAKPFLLKWTPLAGGTASDFLHVAVQRNGQTIFETGSNPFASSALNGTATSVTLPAGLLLPGEALSASILYLKASALDVFSYPHAVGFSGFGAETTALIRARGGGVPAPVLANVRAGAGALEFEVSASAGRLYSIEASTDLQHWAAIFATNAPSADFLLRLPNNLQQRQSLFRAVAY
jgi:hypothetical protein